MNNRLLVVSLSALMAGVLVLVAAGPIALALVVMGLPFVVLFLITRSAAAGREDNGHFRSPDA